MKKILICFSALLAPALLQAENMQFVTTLAAPVGTFARLDTANPTVATTATRVHFCNTKANEGTVSLKGADAYVETLTLGNGTTLGSDIEEYHIAERLTVYDGAKLTGKALAANNVTAYKDTRSSADTLIGGTATVAGGKTSSLTITSSKTSISDNGERALDGLCWSNAYAKDYNSDGTPKYDGKTYLLTSGCTADTECQHPFMLDGGYIDEELCCDALDPYEEQNACCGDAVYLMCYAGDGSGPYQNGENAPKTFSLRDTSIDFAGEYAKFSRTCTGGSNMGLRNEAKFSCGEATEEGKTCFWEVSSTPTTGYTEWDAGVAYYDIVRKKVDGGINSFTLEGTEDPGSSYVPDSNCVTGQACSSTSYSCTRDYWEFYNCSCSPKNDPTQAWCKCDYVIPQNKCTCSE